MSSVPAEHEGLRCSFCGRAGAEVEKLVTGPGVYICGDCVDLAASIVAAHRGAPNGLQLPDRAELTDEQLLARLPQVAAVAERVETDLRTWVGDLRRRGVTWARIGEALGITRQSAWERFSGEE
ncbi:ClpX C4-type zinc finger protein [Kitasatospora sp. NPDC094015]|uniref:ClpX C4-type zinc finger protein n=1 Tax=Kitasatospora sp. NPDC094015 TaxID=3155205 RepID=UPI00331AD857